MVSNTPLDEMFLGEAYGYHPRCAFDLLGIHGYSVLHEMIFYTQSTQWRLTLGNGRKTIVDPIILCIITTIPMTGIVTVMINLTYQQIHKIIRMIMSNYRH